MQAEAGDVGAQAGAGDVGGKATEDSILKILLNILKNQNASLKIKRILLINWKNATMKINRMLLRKYLL